MPYKMGTTRDHLVLLAAEPVRGNQFFGVEDSQLIALGAYGQFAPRILEKYRIAIALIFEVAILMTFPGLDHLDAVDPVGHGQQFFFFQSFKGHALRRAMYPRVRDVVKPVTQLHIQFVQRQMFDV